MIRNILQKHQLTAALKAHPSPSASSVSSILRLQCQAAYTTSTAQWIARQSNDQYVRLAQKEDLRSRASFKLEQMQKAYDIIKKTDLVVDLGASPGGWSQVAVKHAKRGKVVAVDVLPMDPVKGATFIQGDMLDVRVQQRLIDELGGKPANVVLSDMAHSFTGHRSIDVVRVKQLCDVAFSVAERILRPGGNFVCKFIQGEGSDDLRNSLKSRFAKVIYDKPLASRADSAEGYLICLNHAAPNATQLVNEFRHRQSVDTVVPPHWKELGPGTRIMATLPGGIQEKSEIETVLSRDYHAKGVKVRLVDGRLARATALLLENAE
ncbi:hypothetical protein HDU97_005604 [Phlyctochytrium planicorne]|nr:hypothetical protein HDU97_005604 [Phlyctochytrium planicorne]